MELIWQMTTMEVKRKLKNISNKCAIRAIESFRPVTLSSLRSKSSAGSILIEIEESTILSQFFRIEIVKKSIFEYLPKLLRIGIE